MLASEKSICVRRSKQYYELHFPRVKMDSLIKEMTRKAVLLMYKHIGAHVQEMSGLLHSFYMLHFTFSIKQRQEEEITC